MNKIYILDTTLRDGEQAPGYSLTPSLRLQTALFLERLGVDIIEAGFPAASDQQLKSIQEISKNVKSSTIAVMSRSLESDIIIAAKALKYAKSGMIHVSIATSPIHRKDKLRLTCKEILKRVKDCVWTASHYCDLVEFGAEDATRTELPFLLDVYETAIDCGALVINLPDTLGLSTPDEYRALAAYIFQNCSRVRNGEVRLSVHCHNDLGCALANSIVGIGAGARQVEVTLGGIGERAGNTSLEGIHGVLKTKSELFFDLKTSLIDQHIEQISGFVKKITRMPIPSHQPVIGRNYRRHASGIHQDGISKNPQTYHIHSNRNFKIELSQHSGCHGFLMYLEQLGLAHKKPKSVTLEQEFLAFKKQFKNTPAVFEIDILHFLNERQWDVPKVKLPTEIYFSESIGVEECLSHCTFNLISSDGSNDEITSMGTNDEEAIVGCIEKLCKIKLKCQNAEISKIIENNECYCRVVVQIMIDSKIVEGAAYTSELKWAFFKAVYNAVLRHTLEEA